MMTKGTRLLNIQIRFEQDVVLCRQRARQIAESLGFEPQDRIRIATAVSEIARNAFLYAKGGTVQFFLHHDLQQIFLMAVEDNGPGIPHLKRVLDGQYQSETGIGLGIFGSRRLMDRFEIESIPGKGTSIVMGKILPQRVPVLSSKDLDRIATNLAQEEPKDLLGEIQQQNKELIRALAELQKRQEELNYINRELEDTNRGVVALYAELDEKAESLQRVNEIKTRFLSNMSHEFRTPLNSIISLSGLLLDRLDGELSTDQEKQISLIRKSAEELSELVNDLLDIAKVEAGKLTVSPREFEISELFGTLRGMLRPLLAHNSSISLVLDDPVGMPPLYTDEGKLAQVLRNFISNALKYTEYGEVRVSAEQDRNQVIFSVTDTGIGISPENIDHIFEDFVQLESPLQRRFKGTGLGLPLSRKLAELLEGRVFVKSELGVGSTFFVTVPLVYGEVQDKVESLASPVADADKEHILVVEDNSETIFLYEKYVEGTAYQLIPARSLKEARQALQGFTPKAIVLDILLDKQNTWEFIPQLKENQVTKDIPIIVVSVVDNSEKALKLGADGFFLKPLDKQTFLSHLNQVIGKKLPPKILIVDEDKRSRYLLKRMLTTSDYRIVEAETGNEGIDLAKTENPQAIFLDLVMTEMSGDKVLHKLKNDPITKDIPVIINTAKAIEAEEKRFLSKSSVAIISKENCSNEEAIAKLREALVKAGLVLKS